MIVLSNINKHYLVDGKTERALHNIQLTVQPGEILGVIGKSGAGKSTLIRCINLLERPESGSVYVNGVDLMTLNAAQLRQARRDIGMVFQHFNLLETRTVFDNVALPLELSKKTKQEISEIVSPLLEKVGLLTLQNKYPCELSGGQKQRVAIARALTTKPRVLLCDEMTSALDPETTDDILALVRSLNQEMKLSIVCVTHEMHVIKMIADRVAVIDAGEIIECASVTDLFKNPNTTIAKRFSQTLLKTELPSELQSRLQKSPFPNAHVLLRLFFFGHAALEPVINEFMRETVLHVTILEAHLEHLRNELMGFMLISMPYNEIELKKSMHFLEGKKVGVQMVGYIDG